MGQRARQLDFALETLNRPLARELRRTNSAKGTPIDKETERTTMKKEPEMMAPTAPK